MKILLLSAIYPAPDIFGVQKDTKVVHYFAKEWKKQGHEVQVVNLHLVPLKRIYRNPVRIIPSKVREYRIDDIPVGLIDVQLIVPHVSRCLKMQGKILTKRIKEYVDKIKFRPDVLFVHYPLSFYGIDVTVLCDNRSAVFHNCDIEQIKEIGLLNASNLIKMYTHIGTRNISGREFLLKNYGVDSRIIYSGIPEEIICDKEVVRKKTETEKETVRILYAGNLIPLKNVDIVIEAVSELPYNYTFTIIGDGPERKKLESLARHNKCENNVIFEGRLTREETIQKMRESDIFAMVSSPETFGLVYIEAMSQGCIPIACKGEGIDGVIRENDNGFLVQPRDVSALSDCLRKICKMDNVSKTRIIQNAFNQAKEMTDQKMAQEYINILS